MFQAYLGRDPKLLRRLSKVTGVKFLTNTGYYGARRGTFLPKHALRESADELAKRWIAEWQDGIESTGIRPGFIKIGVDAGPLTEVNRKLVQAAARAHLKTGLTIAGHTGDGKAALEQVAILRKEGVSPSAWVWVHAQNERNVDVHLQVSRAGGWVELLSPLFQVGLINHICRSRLSAGRQTVFRCALPATGRALSGKQRITPTKLNASSQWCRHKSSSGIRPETRGPPNQAQRQL